jgi:hypothetical protein
MGYADAAAREGVPAIGGCVASGFWHGENGPPDFGYVASLRGGNGVLANEHVNALIAVGPHELIC